MAPKRLEDCTTLEETRAFWRESIERGRAYSERVDPTGMTRPPRDPDERAFLEKHGGLGPFIEKPNPPWAKGWPPRNPNRPLTYMEQFNDALNALWRAELDADLEARQAEEQARTEESGIPPNADEPTTP